MPAYIEHKLVQAPCQNRQRVDRNKEHHNRHDPKLHHRLDRVKGKRGPWRRVVAFVMDEVYIRIYCLDMHEPMAPVEVSVMCHNEKYNRESEIPHRMCMYISIYFCVAVFGEKENAHSHDVKNKHGQQRVTYFPDDVFILGDLLLYLKPNHFGFKHDI